MSGRIGYSKGISADIDLTGDRMFSEGVRPLVAENLVKPGELPWTKDGRRRRQDRYRCREVEHEIDREVIQWILDNVDMSDAIEITSDYDAAVYYDSTNSTSTSGDTPQYWISVNTPGVDDISLQERTLKKIAATETKIIEEFRQTGNIDLLDKLPNTLRIREGQLIYESVTSSWSKYRMNEYESYTNTMSFYTYSTNTTSSWKSVTSRRPIQYPIDAGGQVITPYEFNATVKLTREELNGALICGRVADIADKIPLRNFMQKVQAYLDVRAKHDHHDLTAIGPRYTGELKMNRHAHSLIDQLYRVLGDPLKLVTKTHMYSFADQSDWYKRRKDKTIDFFFQPVYEDRGLSLIRRPRNSHELRVDLEDRPFIEEDDVPWASQSNLTYDKFHLYENVTPELMLRREFVFDAMARHHPEIIRA